MSSRHNWVPQTIGNRMTSVSTGYRRGQLALKLQEAMTAAVRLRSNRQVAADAGAFRTHIKHLLGVADQEARQLGYEGNDIKLAIYAYVVFLDESVLNSPQPMFTDWPRRPLQEEIFGGHMGGEIFFDNLKELLGRQDSDDLADLLEVYQLCLLLGFHGRYGMDREGELRGLTSPISDRIQRIRGAYGELSPHWAPPTDEKPPSYRDPWIRRLGISAIIAFTVACALYVIFDFSLRSGATELRLLAAQLLR